MGDFGYMWGNTEQVALGELPAIPLVQYCEYSTPAMEEILDLAIDSHRNWILDWIKGTSEFLSKFKVQKEAINSQDYQDLQETEILLFDDKTELFGPKMQPARMSPKLLEDMLESQQKGRETRHSQLSHLYAKAFSEALGIKSGDYPQNPFKVYPDFVDVAQTYQIDHPQFNFLNCNMLRGGMFGWDPELGAPECVIKSISRLMKKIS